MADRARISTWRPGLMAQGSGLHARQPGAATLDEKRAAQAPLGGPPVTATLDETWAVQASLGEPTGGCGGG
jgi:hypothetical protein